MPIPNHCVECDTPVIDDVMCDKCKEDEDPMSNCCDAPFTYPGWPDSDLCSECHEHAGVSEDE